MNETRRQLWMELSNLWLDTVLTDEELNRIASVVKDSGLSRDELEVVFRYELAPFLGPNLLSTAGEWDGFDLEWVCKQAQKRLGKWRPLERLLATIGLTTSGARPAWNRVLDIALRDQANCQEGDDKMGTAETPMADEAFWEIVEEAKRAAADRESRNIALRECLVARTASEISAFDSAYHVKLAHAYRWDLWGAAYVIDGGCSDDGFRYFRDFLISEGRTVYEWAITDPDSLAQLEDASELDLESYGYAAMEAYEAVTGSQLPTGRASAPSEPVGDEWEEEDLKKHFPQLAAKYDWDT